MSELGRAESLIDRLGRREADTDECMGELPEAVEGFMISGVEGREAIRAAIARGRVGERLLRVASREAARAAAERSRDRLFLALVAVVMEDARADAGATVAALERLLAVARGIPVNGQALARRALSYSGDRGGVRGAYEVASRPPRSRRASELAPGELRRELGLLRGLL